jgi:hypothetical protein
MSLTTIDEAVNVTTVYKFPRWVLVTVVAVLCVPQCFLAGWLLLASGLPVSGIGLAMGAATCLIWFALGFVASRLSQSVDPRGIKLFSTKFLPWSEVKSFRERRIAGLTYLEFVTQTGAKHVLCVTLPSGRNFRSAVNAHVRVLPSE